MEKETKVTAEEFYRAKIKELQPFKESITLAQEMITGEQGLRWAHEFADLKCAPLISQLELQENYNDMLVKELDELKQQADKMAKVLELVANYQSNQASVFQINKAAISALANYKQTKH